MVLLEQIDCSGVQNLETLVELEILFSSFDEFANLEGCTHLRRLSCKWSHYSVPLSAPIIMHNPLFSAGIDNGLKRISNLQPLGMTLTSLCLCDQVRFASALPISRNSK